jgi:mono/diheme cytochrome c family protein
MKSQYLVRFVLSMLVLFALVSIAFAGGWATITLNDFPDYAVAGRALNLTFTIRQHGQTPLAGLQPGVRATTGNGRIATAVAKPGASRGEYAAVLTLPEPGEWTIVIDSGFNESATTLPNLKVIAAGTAAPTSFSPATRGLRLFAAKGCVGCHRHLEVNPERKTDTKFDLTGRRFQQDYLKKFLADPSIKPAEMPNLNLKQDEIEALAAFINKAVVKQQPR